MEFDNPYQSPLAPAAIEQPESVTETNLASKGQRFGNFLLDQVFVLVMSFAIGVALSLLDIDLESVPDLVFGLILMLVYYVPQEAIFARTIAKLITGTKVVTEDGEAPGLGKVIGRTFARMIPFEPFSFLPSGSLGWHDRLSGTRVVRTR